jgi:putative flippase GtrA
MVVKTFASRQFVRFLIAGGIAAGVNFTVGFLLSGRLPLYGDIVVGYLAGMLTAFFLFEQNVFGEHVESRSKSVRIFIVVNILGLFQTWIVFALLKDYLFPLAGYDVYPAEMARAIAIIVPTFTSFLGHKFFTFKQ